MCCSLEEEKIALCEETATMKATMEAMENSLQSDASSAAPAVPIDESHAAARMRLSKSFHATILNWFQEAEEGNFHIMTCSLSW